MKLSIQSVAQRYGRLISNVPFSSDRILGFLHCRKCERTGAAHSIDNI
jgi:hypothetical protein